MTDLAHWHARVIPAVEVPPPHLNQYPNGVFRQVPSYNSSTPPFHLPDRWTLAWASRLLTLRQSGPTIAGQGTANAPATVAWGVRHGATATWPSPVGLVLDISDGAAMVTLPALPPAEPRTADDAVHAIAIDHTALVGTRWAAPAAPVPRPDTAQWELLSTTALPILIRPVPTGQPIVIGNRTTASSAWPSVWNGLIYWVEMRAGLTPGQGEVLWRWDAAEIPAPVTASYTDPRGRVWNQQAAPAVDLGLPVPRRAVVSRVHEHIFTGTGAPGTLPNQAVGDRYVDTATGDVWTLLGPTLRNLLYSDQQASIEAGSTEPGGTSPIAGFFPWGSPQTNPRTTAAARHGSSCLAMMRGDGSAGPVQANPQSSASTVWPGRYPLTGGQTYTLMASAWVPPGAAYDFVQLGIASLRDAQGTALPTMPSSPQLPARGAWHDHRWVFSPPANAVDGAPLLTTYVGAGEVAYLDRVGLFAGDVASEDWLLPSEYRAATSWVLTHPANP